MSEATFEGTQTITFSIPYQGQNFTGLVTFTGNNLGDRSSTYDPAGVINAGSTTTPSSASTIDNATS